MFLSEINYRSVAGHAAVSSDSSKLSMEISDFSSVRARNHDSYILYILCSAYMRCYVYAYI